MNLHRFSDSDRPISPLWEAALPQDMPQRVLVPAVVVLLEC